LIEWLIDWLIEWSIDWMIDWLNDWLIDSLIEWLIDWKWWLRAGQDARNFFQDVFVVVCYLLFAHWPKKID
jgi:hypothetical protein